MSADTLGVHLSYELGTAYVSVVAKTTGMGKQIQADLGGAAESAGSAAGKKAGGKFGGAFAGVVKKAGAIGAAVTAGLAIQGGISRALNIEDAQAKLSGLGHDAKSVSQIMDNAMASVKGTAFGMGDAAKVAAGVVAAGVKPGQELERTLKLVGDSATIAGTGMGEMGAIFNKVASSNKIQGDVIAQLNDAGIPIVQLLGDELGKTAEEVTKMASKGEIGFSTFQDAMQKGLGGAAQKSGETFRGSLANTRAALGRVGETLLGPFLEGAKTGMNKLIPIIDSVNTFLKPIMAKVGPALAGAFSTIGPILSNVWAGMQPFLQGLQTAFGPAIDTVVQAFSTLGPQLAEIWQGFSPLSLIMQAITPILPVLAQAFEAVGTALAQIIPPIAEVGRTIMDALVPVITQIIETLLPPLIDIFTQIAPVIGQLVEAFAPLISTLVDLLMPVIEALLPVVRTVFEAIAPIITSALEIITGIIKTVTALLKGDWEGVWEGIKQILAAAWEFIKSIVQGAINIVVGIFQNFGSVISGVWTNMWNGIKSFFSGIWQNLTNSVKVGIVRVVTFFQRMGPQIMGFVRDLPGKLLEVGRQMVQGLINGIGNIGEKVGQVLGDGIGGAVNGVKSMLGIHSPSRLFRDEIGAMIPAGMTLGIEGGVNGAVGAAQSLADSVSAAGRANITGTQIRTYRAPTASSAQPAAVSGAGLQATFHISAHDPEGVAREVESRLERRFAAQGMRI